MIGTPFETNDEIHNKRIAKIDKKPGEEFALDDKNRRLFHGAFKGGNVAGFMNSCGSEEGFMP